MGYQLSKNFNITSKNLKNTTLVFILFSSTMLVLFFSLQFTQATIPTVLQEPGTLVRWGLPISKLAHNLFAATTIGILLFASCILPYPKKTQNSFNKAMHYASLSSTTWAITAILVLVFSYANTSGSAINFGEEFSKQLKFFIFNLPTGQAYATIVAITVTLATLCYAVRSQTGAGILTILALSGLIPLALIGHAAGSNNHEAAVNSLALHLLGASVWLGGLIALLLFSFQKETDFVTIAKRYSTFAIFAFILVTFSGTVSAVIRLDGLAAINTKYGSIVVMKTLLTLSLGFIGWIHRKKLLKKLANMGKKKLFLQLVVVECFIIFAVSALAVTLGQSPTPTPDGIQANATAAEILTSYVMPDELTLVRWFTVWRINVLWLVITSVLAITYLQAVYVLKKRKTPWPWYRSVFWFTGLFALMYVTSGSVAVYGKILFSTHMVGHMLLTMVVPIFLVLAAPVTLALKSLKKRSDGSRGFREWVLVITHSRYATFITNPLVAAAIFAGSIIVFYYTNLFGFALREHVGHELMYLHFLFSGYLFAFTLIGVDPAAKRLSYPMRLLLLLATMAFHAFFGVTLMQSDSLLQASFFGSTGRPWGVSALADQQIGGGVAWGIGEIPTIIIAMIVVFQWSRSDARQMRRLDRAADRDNEADLKAYNKMLRNLR